MAQTFSAPRVQQQTQTCMRTLEAS